ncbi:DUF4271 domain-containing protein [Prevotella sp. tf2-5]|uniref:DUF4271 domain-containing protein n=1 Tax=Prevotella sp. tf2-5 TaxID=1761889 RepID=UPI0008E38F18|nr:DUF4271 domain-containing protein [Prevotella sp. tf2-5]SFO98392.1 protein of unknown function [Prevotella sp. tf2-5]
MQQDSIANVSTDISGSDSAAVKHHPLTPAQVLSWLPHNATPAQQDSAIQSRFHPGEIHWSEHPDTLHLPGHPPGVDLMKAEIPQYYREGFFSKDSLFHPELQGGRIGVAGDPVPYRVHNDNVITSLLLACFLVSIYLFANARQFFIKEAKNFFYTPREERTDFSETGNELRYQVFLVGITSLLISLLFYFHTLYYIGETFILQSQYTLIAIYFVIVIIYVGVKMGLYTFVNLVFFNGKRNQQWLKSFLFIITLEGVLLFPAVLLGGYYEMDIHNVTTYVIISILFVKLLTIYKCFIIFFRPNVVSLQIILYFCTLEIVPLLALWGVLVMTANNLKINF